jgi:hypothetical protein
MTNIRKETDLEKWENSISSSQGMIKTATVSGTVVAMKSDHRPAKPAPAYNTITADEVMQSLKETIHEIQAPPHHQTHLINLAPGAKPG